VCRMFNRIVAGIALPSHLSSDHDPLFEYHRWRPLGQGPSNPRECGSPAPVAPPSGSPALRRSLHAHQVRSG
jgi:hypothetical protein